MESVKFELRRFVARVIRFVKLYIIKDEFTVEAKRWVKDNGDKTHRLDYPTLNSDSIVFDLGGYLGDFAYEINRKYGCHVYVFEPHPKFYNQCIERFRDNEKITPYNFGVSDRDGKFTLSDSVDGSSFINPKHSDKKGVTCEVKELFSVLNYLGIKTIDLMKINIEGAEYPLLNHIVKQNKASTVNNYQIQFHNFVDDADRQRDTLVSELKKTHKRTWCYKFIWENWERL